jgi:hypothetical protein
MMKTLFTAMLLAVVPALAADIYTFTVPEGVTVTTPAGLETGWGYTLQNGSSTNWLVTTGLNAGAFQYATPQLIFDFPALAPGQSVTVPYNPASPATGLYQILWNANAPAGFVNSGAFTLSAQWWSSDPTNGGRLIGTAPSASQPYSVAVATPEPATSALIAVSLLLFGAIGVRRHQTFSRIAERGA